ncbi:AEC family transporter [Stutzerimonas azotifigens]|uniref:AEC family transporter n=1 Tax=Stutzerimonas azotifigens TaxID=291995 RepID=A0ABR5Z7D9_9GAMM|nr:AEC family transporter [Stutzerimonas azotifigens]MBA1276085.1 AEC family transporter [Stutzerimonas azotifigens]
MLQILSITTPIFLLIGLGYFAARSGLVSREQIRGMGIFAMTFALPALILRALSQRPIGEIVDPVFVLAYGLGSLLIFALGFAFFRLVRGQSVASCALSAGGMSVSNSGFIGFPVVAMVLGAPAGVALALCMLIENLLIIPLMLFFAEASGQQGKGRGALLGETFKRLARNPIILAIVLGLCLSLLQVSIPAIPLKAIDMLANASAPVALFVIGGTLFGLRIGGAGTEIALVALAKLILHPLAVGLAFAVLPDIDPTMRLAGILFASAPMLSVYPLFGQRFGFEERCAAILVTATALSFFTMGGVLALMGAGVF